MGSALVTGAGGYLGRYITARLLARGGTVQSLTRHPERLAGFERPVRALPYQLSDPVALARAMTGTDVLYNTYWVRFARGSVSHETAVRASRVLFEAARMAGVQRVVHISVTSPDPASPLPYFRGKAQVEAALQESGLPHAILRPSVLFGVEDILINNIAWLLRRLPVFALPGGGDYVVQPVFVDDVAALAVEQGLSRDTVVRDAVGSERYTFAELVATIREAVGSRASLFPVPAAVARGVVRIAGWALRDVVLTGDELRGLMSNLLVSADEAACPTRFSTWVSTHGRTLGAVYQNELARHYT
jgi:uncharacterized protein YbjT (DUF2867 family)